MSDETTSRLFDKLERIQRVVTEIKTNQDHQTHMMAKHQEQIATNADEIESIRLARARERGYVAGVLAVGSLVGGLAVKLLGL
jgi:ABC-type transport system involved in Fe-S cluster assembly fused permease/ATPase subunit